MQPATSIRTVVPSKIFAQQHFPKASWISSAGWLQSKPLCSLISSTQSLRPSKKTSTTKVPSIHSTDWCPSLSFPKILWRGIWLQVSKVPISNPGQFINPCRSILFTIHLNTTRSLSRKPPSKWKPNAMRSIGVLLRRTGRSFLLWLRGSDKSARRNMSPWRVSSLRLNLSSTNLLGGWLGSSKKEEQKPGCATMKTCLHIFPWFSWQKSTSFFMHFASFSQNLINTNKIEVGDDKFETKMVTTAVKLESKFLNKMQEHIDDNSIPKDVPKFAKSFFVKATGGASPLHQRLTTQRREPRLNKQKVQATNTNPPAMSRRERKYKRKNFLIKVWRWASFTWRKELPPPKPSLIRVCWRTALGSVWISAAMKKKQLSPCALQEWEALY